MSLKCAFSTNEIEISKSAGLPWIKLCLWVRVAPVLPGCDGRCLRWSSVTPRLPAAAAAVGADGTTDAAAVSGDVTGPLQRRLLRLLPQE